MTTEKFNHLISGILPKLKCATQILSSGEHCPEVGVHELDDSGEYLCDKCFTHWTLHKDFFNKLSNNHGGKRPGAGRKPLENPKKPFTLRVTAEESEKLKIYLIELRKHD